MGKAAGARGVGAGGGKIIGGGCFSSDEVVACTHTHTTSIPFPDDASHRNAKTSTTDLVCNVVLGGDSIRRVYDDYERATKHYKELDAWGVDFVSLDERLETARVFVAGKYPEVAHKISEVQNAIWRIRQYAY